MLGWWFVVAQGKSDGRFGPGPEHTLVTWEAGIWGLDWLKELVASGEGKQLRSDGYPNLYEGKAADVLPRMHEEIGKINFTHKLFKPKYRRARIDACLPDDVLTIAAWDQS